MTEQPNLEGIPTESFPARVWKTLSRIDVGDHIETKGNDKFSLSYLSWSWCWSTLMNHFPESDFTVLEEEKFEDGTVNVRIVLLIAENGQQMSRFMWLPVMDNRNNAIQNPSSRHISDSRMRCLVKAAALCGLGTDIYAGSDIPVGLVDEPINSDQVELLSGMLAKLDEDSQKAFLVWLGVERLAEIPHGKYQSARKNLERKLKAMSK